MVVPFEQKLSDISIPRYCTLALPFHIRNAMPYLTAPRRVVLFEKPRYPDPHSVGGCGICGS